MNIDVHEEHRRLADLFGETEAMLEWPDEVLFGAQERISGWSPAQHLYHLWLTSSMSLNAVVAIYGGHEAVAEEGSPNAVGRAVLGGEGFGRGRAQAPENVRPPDDVDRAVLGGTLERSRAKLDEVEAFLDDLPELSGRLPHPVLGVLSAPEWLRFIRIHASHHLDIVHEIEPEP